MPRQLLHDFPQDNARYDEMFSTWGQPREHYDPLFRALAGMSAEEIRLRFGGVDRQIRENGVTYNVYGDEAGTDRPWTLDPLPLVIDAAEWASIEAAVAQRASLLNHILADIYGQQNLLRQGALPPALVFGHAGFLHPMNGAQVPGGAFLNIYAADLARSPDGRWWVMNDRTQAPSGIGYALENRQIISRLFPEMYRAQRVQSLSGFVTALRDSLTGLAPCDDGQANAVVLTPGPYNETYFEHAFLARQLGFPLVEGQDLLVRHGCVWLKTLVGLQRVHAILRRLDDDFCDPLELRADSALGIPGLTEAARRGNVLIANALGSGLLESGALLGYLPGLCQRILGEPLAMPSVATWWCGEPAALDSVEEQLESLVIKPAYPQLRRLPVFGGDLGADGQRKLIQQVRAAPYEYVAQEWVRLSRAPVWNRDHPRRLGARAVGLRVFAVATPRGYQVMPGGLARIASKLDARIISSQRGGGSKDVWVLADGPVTRGASQRRAVGVSELVRTGPNLSSRMVENLFWFGRYTERCDNLARLLRIAIGRELDDTPVEDDREWPAIAELCTTVGLLPRPEEGEEPASGASRTLEFIHAVADPERPFGLAGNLRQLARVGFQLRERLSADNWRTIASLAQEVGSRTPSKVGLFEAMALLDHTVSGTMTLSGFCLDGMTRDQGWRFLSVGRRIERLQFYCQAVEQALAMGEEGGLDWLLELFDSIVTYRARYMSRPEWLPALDLMLADTANPRAIAFQANGLLDYLMRLSSTFGECGAELIAGSVLGLRDLDAQEDYSPASLRLHQALTNLRTDTYRLAEQLSLRFFSHASATMQVAA